MPKFQVSAEPRVSEFEESYDDERQLRGAILSEPLNKVPRRPLVTVPHTATLAEAIDAMNAKHVGCSLVVKRGKLVGIFTERDVLTKVVGNKKVSLAKTTVGEVMTPDPDTLPDTASIAFALHHMSIEGYRHVPLVDAEGCPVGVVAVRDIVSWICELFPASVLNIPPKPEIPLTAEGG